MLSWPQRSVSGQRVRGLSCGAYPTGRRRSTLRPQHLPQSIALRSVEAARERVGSVRAAGQYDHEVGSAPSRRPIDTCRRALLASIFVFLGTDLKPASARFQDRKEVFTDVGQGLQNWARIGFEYYSSFFQSSVDGGSSESSPAAVPEADAGEPALHLNADGSADANLSAFSFIHGLAFGMFAMAFIVADKVANAKASTQGMSGIKQAFKAKSSNEPVKAALESILVGAEARHTFHNPKVQAALQDIRQDLGKLQNYKDDPQVMEAMAELLRIESMLEKI